MQCRRVNFQSTFYSVVAANQIDILNTIGVTYLFLCNLWGVNKYIFSQILDGQYMSAPVKQKVGVLQGDAPPPSLFIKYIADLCPFTSCTLLFYADDLENFSQISLQFWLHIFQFYCPENGLEIIFPKSNESDIRIDARYVNQALSRQTTVESLGESWSAFGVLGYTLMVN